MFDRDILTIKNRSKKLLDDLTGTSYITETKRASSIDCQKENEYER